MSEIPERRQNDILLGRIAQKQEELDRRHQEWADHQDKVIDGLIKSINQNQEIVLKTMDESMAKLSLEIFKYIDTFKEKLVEIEHRYEARFVYMSSKIDEILKTGIIDHSHIETKFGCIDQDIAELKQDVQILKNEPAQKSFKLLSMVKNQIVVTIISFILGGGLFSLLWTILSKIGGH